MSCRYNQLKLDFDDGQQTSVISTTLRMVAIDGREENATGPADWTAGVRARPLESR